MLQIAYYIDEKAKAAILNRQAELDGPGHHCDIVFNEIEAGAYDETWEIIVWIKVRAGFDRNAIWRDVDSQLRQIWRDTRGADWTK